MKTFKYSTSVVGTVSNLLSITKITKHIPTGDLQE